jgi:hypothetical protein
MTEEHERGLYFVMIIIWLSFSTHVIYERIEEAKQEILIELKQK